MERRRLRRVEEVQIWSLNPNVDRTEGKLGRRNKMSWRAAF